MDPTQINGPVAPQHDRLAGQVALLIIDMIICFDFIGAELVARKALPIARAIQRLKNEMIHGGYPTIYVNANFGEWHSVRSHLVPQTQQERRVVILSSA